MGKGFFIKRIVIFMLTMACVSCTPRPTHEQREVRFSIGTSFYPMYALTMRVTQGAKGVAVTNLTKTDAGCVHDYQLNPEDMKVLSHLHVLVVQGGGMEDFVQRLVLPSVKIIETGKGLDWIKAECSNEEGHEHHHESEFNSHAWVSPRLLAQQAQNLAKELALSDPVNAGLYMQNAETYARELNILNDEIREKFKPHHGKKVALLNEAAAYFFRETGLELGAIIEPSVAAYPNAGEMRQVIEKMKKDGVKVLIIEPHHDKALAESIAREVGASVAVFDIVVSGDLQAPSIYQSYLDKMRENIQEVERALASSQ